MSSLLVFFLLVAGQAQAASEGVRWVIQTRDSGAASSVSVEYMGEQTLKRLREYSGGASEELRYVRARIPWAAAASNRAEKKADGKFEFDLSGPGTPGRVVPGDDALNLWIPPIEDPVIDFFEPQTESRARYRSMDRELSVLWIVDVQYDTGRHKPVVERSDFKESSFEAIFDSGPAETVLTDEEKKDRSLPPQAYALRMKLVSRAWELHAQDVLALRKRWALWMGSRLQGGGLSAVPGATSQVELDRWARLEMGLRLGADFPRWESLGVDTWFGGLSFAVNASVEKRLGRWFSLLLGRGEFGLFSGNRFGVSSAERSVEGWLTLGPEIQFRVPGISMPLSSGLSFFFVDLYARPFLQYVFLNDPLVADFGAWWSLAWSAGLRLGRGDWRPGVLLGGPVHLAISLRAQGAIPNVALSGRSSPLAFWAGVEVY